MLYFVFWAVIYGVSYSLSRLFLPSVLPYVVLVYAALLIVWLGYRKRFKTFRICPPALSGWFDVLVMALSLILPAVNLLSGGSFAAGHTVVLMLGVVTAEEIFFRGVLLAEPGTVDIPVISWITEQADCVKAAFSSGLFAVFHVANVISGEEWIQVIPQIIAAFCAGLLFAAVTLRVNSLLPAAAGHFLVNITASEGNVFSLPAVAGSLICLAAGILLLLPACHIRKGNC